MRIGSLFAGIGGFDLAARWMGWDTAWVSEIDPYASAVLKKHWPNAPNLGDITKISKPPTVDILCGGFPCQDISLAGKGEGIGGSRSGLWKHYARLIEETRPKYVVIENVSALRSRGLEVVLSDLAAIGYDAEWHCIPAAYVGAPHRRDRIWIVAYPECEQLRNESGRSGGENRKGPTLSSLYGEAQPVADTDSSGPHAGAFSGVHHGEAGAGSRDGEPQRCGSPCGQGPVEDEMAHPHCLAEPQAGSPAGAIGGERNPRCHAGGGCRSRRSIADWWAVEPPVGRVAHGVRRRVDRLRCLGNAIVPHIAYTIFQAIARAEG